MPEVEWVQQAVLNWYAHHARDLPWRGTRDPYAILVAEVMLQQTQVDRVLPKWYAWLRRFPTIGDLAAASRADALRAWQGLGYNLRAVRLHAIARQVAAERAGVLPRDVAALMRLKGIGRYTAGAVACFAYEQPVAMVDTNVRRVLGRVFSVAPERVQALAEDVVPVQGAWAWNQALMDLGATVCRSRRPLCLVCPLVEQCGGAGYVHTPKRTAPARFVGSARYLRGRVVERLRDGGARLETLVSLADGRRELVDQLVAEGLITISELGTQAQLAE